MGRLRSGESLVSKLSRQGIAICPPSPPKHSVSSDNKKKNNKRSEPILVQISDCDSREASAEESEDTRVLGKRQASRPERLEPAKRAKNVSLRRTRLFPASKSPDESEDRSFDSKTERTGLFPAKRGKKASLGSSSEENDNTLIDDEDFLVSKSPGKRSDESEDRSFDDEPKIGMLSRLGRFPGKKRKNPTFSESKKALISHLASTKELSDVESVIENLNSFQLFHPELFDYVEDITWRRHDVLKAKNEAKKTGPMKLLIESQSDLLELSNSEVSALVSAQSSLARARERVASLAVSIERTEEILRELEEKLQREFVAVDKLQNQCRILEKNYEATKCEQRDIAEEMEEARENGERCREAEAALEAAMARVYSL